MNSLSAYPLLTRTGLARLLCGDASGALAAPGANVRGICKAMAQSKHPVALAESESSQR
jgi:hypothetical protein